MQVSILWLLLISLFSGWDAQGAAAKDIEQKAQAHYAGVTKVNDDLYVGQAADDGGKPIDKFYLGIERVKNDTLGEWIKFADNELHQCLAETVPNFSEEGVEFFHYVLSDFKTELIKPSNEVWVAYVSDAPTEKRGIIHSLDRIKMYVSVTTSADALLTSHVGISRTFKEAKIKKEHRLRPDESMHLHSFAAKVMKERNPKRAYVFTFPTDVMRDIFINKLPKGALFIGDNIYAEFLKNKKNILVLSYGAEGYAERIAWLKSFPPRVNIKKVNNEIEDFSIQMPSGDTLKIERANKNYQWLFTSTFQAGYIDHPNVLVDLEVLANLKKLAGKTS